MAKDERLQARATREENERIAEAAERLGISKSEVIREGAALLVEVARERPAGKGKQADGA